MAGRTRIQGADVRLEAAFPEIFSAAERSRAFAAFAREQIGYAERINAAALGRVPDHDVFVDGRKGAPLESVRPDGEIVAEFRLLEEVLAFIRSQLVAHSPVGRVGDGRPGHPRLYQASHILVIDGELTNAGDPIPPLFTEAVFSNTTPYARKVERGQSVQAPDGVYDAVAYLADRRFGNMARIGFGWRSLITGGIDAYARSPAGRRAGARRGGRPSAVEDWLRRQPSIIVRPR